MTPAVPAHELRHIVWDYDEDHQTRWRWICACGSKGRWTWQSDKVAKFAHKRHVERVSR